MKVSFDLRNNNKVYSSNPIKFQGYKPVKNNEGKREYEFNYPYNANQYDCYLEVCSLGSDDYNNYYIIEGLLNNNSDDGYYKMKPDKNVIDLCDTFGLREDQDFAYHYVLVPKNTDRKNSNVLPIYKIDAGDFIDSTYKGEHEIYNIVTGNGPQGYTGGSMKLLIPDCYNPLWTYNKDGNIVENKKINLNNLKKITKTFSNKIGGSLAGIEKDVVDGKFDGYSRIISTPIFTDDSRSSHGYWNKNCMQMVGSLGNINNYASLQREMFKKGINFVSDGAFVNEGLEGVHFKHVLKWGEKSPYFNWFKADLSNGPLELGVFSKNNDFISHKIVNSPYTYKQDLQTGQIKISSNKSYNSSKPTYIQIFDKRLVSNSLKNDTTKLIDAYDIPNTKSPLDINTHNDTIIPYAFEINPETYNDSIKRINEYNSSLKKSHPPIKDAFDVAFEIVFANNKDNKNKIHDALSKAVNEIEKSNFTSSYSDKVNLIVQKAEEKYNLMLDENDKNRLIKTLNLLKNTVALDSYMGTRFVSKFENFNLEEKFEGNFDTWDANTDIPKLNYLYSNSDTEKIKLQVAPEKQAEAMANLKQKNYEVQDYAIASANYWTGKTNDILTVYIAQNLTGIDYKNPKNAYNKILNNINSGKFPSKLRSEINLDIVKNVLNDDYELSGASAEMEYKDYLLAGLMNLPLDSIEFGDNLTAVLASPFISKRATNDETLGLSRYDVYKMHNPHLTPEYEKTYNKMDSIYKNELTKFANEVLYTVNDTLPNGSKLYDGSNATVYGKYTLPFITEAVAKFAIVKALVPNAQVTYDPQTGEIMYDYEALKQVSLESLGIQASSPEDEAVQVLNKLSAGLKNISQADKRLLAKSICVTLKQTNENSYKLAEMIVDRLNAGLDWRIDATKDIGDINSIKDGKDYIDFIWPDVTQFWKKFSESVYSQNKNSYIVAEFTNTDSIWKEFGGSYSKNYRIHPEIIKKFLRETNMTSIANYTFYYSSILNLFGEHFDGCDKQGSNGFDRALSDRIFNKTGEFIGLIPQTIDDNNRKELAPMPYYSILQSYNFIGNHDKPRTLHGLILDTRWYTVNLEDPSNTYFREKAYRILNDKQLGPILDRKPNENDYDYDQRVRSYLGSYSFANASGKAIAMADTLSEGFKKVIADKYPHGTNKEMNEKVFSAIFKSISDLANGSYLGKNFSAEGFGVKPLDITIDLVLNQAKQEHGLALDLKETEYLKNAVLQTILTPALQKLQAMTEVLAILPGMPTLYAGDDTGTTGYESAAKNIYLQNRSYIHNDWLNPENTKFKYIQEHYKKMNDTMAMRNRPELHALNDGAPFLLDLQHGVSEGKDINVSAILRQGTDNSIVISLVNTSGINHWYANEYKPKNVQLERIDIKNSDEKNPHAFTKGLTPGTVLYNANDENDKYIVKEYNGNIFIKTYNDQPINIQNTTLTLYSKPEK